MYSFTTQNEKEREKERKLKLSIIYLTAFFKCWNEQSFYFMLPLIISLIALYTKIIDNTSK